MPSARYHRGGISKCSAPPALSAERSWSVQLDRQSVVAAKQCLPSDFWQMLSVTSGVASNPSDTANTQCCGHLQSRLVYPSPAPYNICRLTISVQLPVFPRSHSTDHQRHRRLACRVSSDCSISPSFSVRVCVFRDVGLGGDTRWSRGVGEARSGSSQAGS